MAKIRKVKKTSKNSSSKRKPRKKGGGVLSHFVHKVEVQKAPRRVVNPNKVISLFRDGVTIKEALTLSRKVDKERADEQLRAVAPRTVNNTGVFTIIVKSSGLYAKNEWGVASPTIAKTHQVNIAWNLTDFNLDKPTHYIFENAPFYFECSCGRHTYYYRYIWSKIYSSLGKQETRFPKINNASLEGLMCKHGIKMVQVLKGSKFQKTFGRYVENYKIGKGFRLSKKDKMLVTLQSYLGFK